MGFFVKSVGVLLFFIWHESALHGDAIATDRIPHRFSYDLDLRILGDYESPEPITIVCHGYGGSSLFVRELQKLNVFPGPLVGFNFPDHDIQPSYDYTQSSFGTFNEIAPLVYILRILVGDRPEKSIILYGFSAGGGAVINTLVALVTGRYDDYLLQLGIDLHEKELIMEALKAGHIILDCPLKSLDEIFTVRPPTDELLFLASQYRSNGMTPIENLQYLVGADLTIWLHFQKPDEVLGNRDDELFVRLLTDANKEGTVRLITGYDGGHSALHCSLWNAYRSWLVVQEK